MKKKGEFYLGKAFDLKKKKITDDELLYPSEDLTTHVKTWQRIHPA